VNQQLAEYIASKYHRRPDGRITLKKVYHGFLATLDDERSRKLWPRWRFLQEIAGEFQTGLDGSNRLCIAGLSNEPPQHWKVVDGRIRLEPVKEPVA
jgi:hypothetical protein